MAFWAFDLGFIRNGVQIELFALQNHLVREVQDVPDQLVVHIYPVNEFLGIKNCVGKFRADLCLQFADALFYMAFPHSVADYQDVHPGILVLYENTRHYQELHLARLFESF